MLAINGGKPIRDKFLPYGKQYIDSDDIKEVIKVLESDYLTTGPSVLEFEKAICDYIGCKYAVSFCNGTAALHAACFSCQIEKSDEVIVSSITFAASSNCVLYCMGKPVFCDINDNNFNIDVNQIEKLITPNTKAIIAVHFTGQSVDLDKIHEIAKKHNLIVIEDGAHALGTKYKGKYIGNISDMTMFSFHPVKTITTCEGGIITTNNKEYYEKLLLFRSHGITRSDLINKNEGDWYYEQLELGYNYRLSDVQASLGVSQLRKINKFIERRNYITNLYNNKLSQIDGIILQQNENYSETSKHIYILRLELEKFNVSRKEIYEALKYENIGVNVHYLPVYLHPYYQNLGYKKGICKNAEKLYEEMITIPLYPSMSDSDVYDVINAIKKVLDYYRI